MLKIGLTGGIGSGKTTISDLFANLGVPIIDTDVIAHELVDDKCVLDGIVRIFGNKILDKNKKLNRKILSQLVFNKKEDKQKLEDILHPAIRTVVNEKIHQLATSSYAPPYIIIVIPLLIETNFSQIINRTLTVMADEKNRIMRIKQRDNRDMEEIRAIISTQATDQQRLDVADDIIENNKDIKELDLQIQVLHKKYLAIATDIK
jgi:dephospho-CoA kinase